MILLGQLLISLALTLGYFACAQRDGLRVSTQQGDVIGTLSAPSVRQFLGIPYASAKRWQSPVLPRKRTQPLNASSFGDSCPQLLSPLNVEFNLLAWTFNRTGDIFVPMSEDCLTVNIWSPSVSRKQNTSVMLWVHGGAFNWGTSRLPIYDATNLVRDNDDIIVVSFNYRLNIFGQPNAPQLDKPGKAQNFGLLDLDAAVKWVHANIANFGGDPERIILFGQSAGAIAIDAYTLANPNDTMVKGVIEQSGNSFLWLERVTSTSIFNPAGVPRINSTTWTSVSELVGCGSASTEEQFSCMEQVPTQQLNDAVIRNGVNFIPVYDDVTNFRNAQDRAAKGQFLNVPMLVGVTRDEQDVFTAAQEILAVGHVIPVLLELTADIITTVTFTCGMENFTTARLQGRADIFRYQYQAVFPNLSLQPELRAFHGSEIPIIFGTYTHSPITATQTEVEFAKYLQSAWVAFARDPKQGLIDFGWPRYDPSTASIILLGNAMNQTGATFTSPADIDVLCPSRPLLLDTLAGLMKVPLR